MEIRTISSDIVTLLSELNPDNDPYTLALPIDHKSQLKVSSQIKDHHLLCQIEVDPAHFESAAEKLRFQRHLLNLTSQTENTSSLIASLTDEGYYAISSFISKNETLSEVIRIISSLLENSIQPNQHQSSIGEPTWMSV